MGQTMIHNGWEMPFRTGTGTTSANHGRFASWIGLGGTAKRILLIAPIVVADVPGISVPNGRRLRS